jgi:hypothetical protein
MLAVAARNSSSADAASEISDDRSAWIASLPAAEKDELLIRVMAGDAPGIGMELQSRFRRQRMPGPGLAEATPRTVAELLSAAKTYGENRQREEQKKAGVERERQAKQAALARERHLESLKGRGGQIWASVETLTATRLPKSYDQAVQHLVDLRDLAEREGHQAGFKERLAIFRNQHCAKKSLMDRLTTGGL